MKQHHEREGPVRAAVLPRAAALCMRWRWVTIAVTVARVRAVALRHALRPAAVLPVLRPPRADRRLEPAAEQPRSPKPRRRWRSSSRRRSPAIPTSSTGRPMSGRARCASCCRSTSSRRHPSFGQIVIVTKGLEARERAEGRAAGISERRLRRHRRLSSSCSISARRSGGRCNTGSAGRTSRRSASMRRNSPASSRSNPHLGDVVYDWNEPARVVKVDVLQDKARQLGVTSRGHRLGAERHRRRHHRHAGARRHLLDQRRRPRQGVRARLDRDAAEPAAARAERPVRAARRGRDLPLRARAAGRSGAAPRMPTITRQGRHSSTRRSRRPWSQQLEPQVDAIHRQAAGRLPASTIGGSGRGKRQEPGADRRRRAADAVRHGDDPDDPAAELPAAVPGVRGGAAGADRRGRGACCRAARRSASSPSWACWR